MVIDFSGNAENIREAFRVTAQTTAIHHRETPMACSQPDYRLKVAYPTATGWDFATGLVTTSIASLVSAWYVYSQDFLQPNPRISWSPSVGGAAQKVTVGRKMEGGELF
jgi:hypothetical protein